MDQAVRTVCAQRRELGTSQGTVKRVGDQVGIGVESLRSWVKQAEIDTGARSGTTSADAAENNRSITVMLDRYGYLMPGTDDDVAAGIDALVTGPLSSDVVPIRRWDCGLVCVSGVVRSGPR